MRKCNMETLTEKEILDQLKKLGIDSASERNSYIREYRNYCGLQNFHTHSFPACREAKDDIRTHRRILSNRFARACNSIVTLVMDSVFLSRVRSCKPTKR